MADNHNVNASLISVSRELLSQFGVTQNENGTFNSTKTSITDENGNILLPSGSPEKLTATITRPANTTSYTAGDAIGGLAAAVKQKETISFTGTGGTANVTGTGGLTKLATFRDDLVTTAIDFESAHGAAYATAGVTLTRNMGDIILEATVAGVPFIAPVVTNMTATLGGTVAHTTANVTLIPVTVLNASVANGGGGLIIDATIETDAVQFAGKTVKLWLYNETPVGLVGDNVAFVDSFLNSGKRNALPYITITFEALGAGSDTVFGSAQPAGQYTCALADNKIYLLLQTLSDVITPKSAGIFNIYMNVLKLA